MPSLGSILSIAGTALRTQQRALEVTSHNIANVNTDGYTRQRAVLSPTAPLVITDGIFGTGVSLVDVQRMRDAYADAAYRRDTAMEGRYQTRHDLLSRVETVLGEPGEAGLGAVLDRFFSAWSDLSSDPTGSPQRSAVLDAGQELADEFRRLSAALAIVRADAETQLGDSVDRANALAAEIATLNADIVAAESGGRTASDLRDARGRALDELASLAPIEVIEQANGSARVVLDGFGLVDGTNAARLEATVIGGETVVRSQGGALRLPLSSGSLAGLLEVLNGDISTARGALDLLAADLVAEVNALHRTGTNPAGATGVDFFDPAGTLASTLSLSAAVAGDPDQVAAGTGSPDVVPVYRAGANDVALALAGLRDRPVAGGTFGERFTDLVTRVGATARSVGQTAEVHHVLAEQSLIRRESAAGVSIDEEMVDLIRFQSAYGAAARVITTADEMLESLLRM
jgi:flagellar hook-associated protein 1 FlgK